MASAIGGVKDLVVEDGEVEGKTETDRVCRREFGDSDVGGGLVSLEGLVGRLLSLIARGKLGKVTVVVTLHLVIKDFRFAGGSGGDKVLVKDLEDILADLCKLRLDLLPVALNHGDLGLISFRFLLLLDGGDDPPRGAAGTDNVLIGDGEQIALLDCKFLIGGSHALHVLNHLYGVASDDVNGWVDVGKGTTFIPLGLFGELGKVDGIFTSLGHLERKRV